MLMSSTDSLSRLVNLYLLLINSKSPLTLTEITSQVGGFPESHEARRQAFERAKRDLRTLGLPITTTRSSFNGTDAYYVETPSQTRLAPSLSLDEALALSGAMACVRFGQETALESARKLGCVFDGEMVELASVPRLPKVVQLFQAINASEQVSFFYSDKQRLVVPYGVVFRWGNWYLVGKETNSKIVKSFRVDLIQHEVIRTESHFLRDETVDVASAIPTRRLALVEGDLSVVSIEFASELKVFVQDKFLELDNVHENAGKTSCTVKVGAPSALLATILEFGDKFRVVGPVEIRQDLVSKLNLARQAQHKAIDSLAVIDPQVLSQTIIPDYDTDLESKRRSAETVITQFKRVMALLAWLQRNPRTTTKEIANLFDIKPAAVGTLLERVACCGLPPFSPESLIDIIVDGEQIISEISDQFGVGLTLNYDDLFVIALSAKLVLTTGGFEGREFLESALQKIFETYDFSLDFDDSLVINFMGQRNFADIRVAIDSRLQISFDYFAESRAAVSRRQVDPYLLFSAGEYWYLRAFCHISEGVRSFRLDRIDSLEILDTEITRPPTQEDVTLSAFSLDSDDFREGNLTVVGCKPGKSWRLELVPYKALGIVDSSGNELFLINVASRKWLANLVAGAAGDVVVAWPKIQVESCVSDLDAIYERFSIN